MSVWEFGYERQCGIVTTAKQKKVLKISEILLIYRKKQSQLLRILHDIREKSLVIREKSLVEPPPTEFPLSKTNVF